MKLASPPRDLPVLNGGRKLMGTIGDMQNMAFLLAALLLLLHVSPVFSLKCLQCIGTSTSCRMVVRTCPFYETTCLSLAYKGVKGSTVSDTVMKGCSTPHLCNQTSIIDAETQSISMSSTCCESNFCNLNRYSTVSVFSNRLWCHACKDPTKSCSSIADTVRMLCDGVNNYCVDVATVNTTNGKESGTSYFRGCGSGDGCNTLLSYNTGSHQHFTQYSCCNKNDNCNKNVIKPKILTNENGIKCWGCHENVSNPCTPDKQKIISCKGIQIRCMEVFDNKNQTWLKGCSTVNFCSSTYPHLYMLPNISGIECCAGSLCNNFTRISSVNETDIANTATSYAQRTNTDFRLLFILMIFLCVTIRHFH